MELITLNELMVLKHVTIEAVHLMTLKKLASSDNPDIPLGGAQMVSIPLWK